MAFHNAIGWVDAASVPLKVFWVKSECLEPIRSLISSNLPLTSRRRRATLRLLETGTPVQRDRAAYTLLDRLAVSAALCRCPTAGTWHLTKTALGRPTVVYNGCDVPLRVSFSHDAGTHIAVTACDERLAGIGVDLVHLPRLARFETRSRMIRFCRQFMSTEELEMIEAPWSSGLFKVEDDRQHSLLTIRAAAHFSLMESASKALGCGLKIGGGVGRPASLPKRSIGVRNLHPVEWLLDHPAQARMQALRSHRLEGYWGVHGEMLVSCTLLLRR